MAQSKNKRESNAYLWCEKISHTAEDTKRRKEKKYWDDENDADKIKAFFTQAL